MKRSKHSLSHYHLMTATMGRLVPATCYEVLPGDTIQHRTSALIRMQPMAAPVMHPVTARFHNFEVPFRLIWGDKWADSGSFEDFITGGEDGNDTQTQPTITLTFATVDDHTGSVADYLGVPYPGDALPITVSALPFRAMINVFNEYYRDQDLVPKIGTTETDVITFAQDQCPRVSWSKDYFTTARPWAQKGTEITLPLGNSATVIPDPNDARAQMRDYQTTNTPAYIAAQPGTPGPLGKNFTQPSSANPVIQEWLSTGMVADLANAEGVDINTFRRAFALQRYQEARAQYGSRYTEYLQYLGITPADSRLQRPTYLGGAKQTVQFSEVLQTGQESAAAQSQIGDLYGHGIAAMRARRSRKFFQEHALVISFMSVIPMPMYTNGLHRMHYRRDKEDYFQRELAQIGQQTIFNGEVYADGTATDAETFGFQDRYSEYKHLPSTVHGEFRNTLNYWHLGRDFASLPALNQTFVECSPSDRIFNVVDGDKMLVMVNHSIQARRMVPKSSKSRIL